MLYIVCLLLWNLKLPQEQVYQRTAFLNQILICSCSLALFLIVFQRKTFENQLLSMFRRFPSVSSLSFLQQVPQFSFLFNKNPGKSRILQRVDSSRGDEVSRQFQLQTDPEKIVTFIFLNFLPPLFSLSFWRQVQKTINLTSQMKKLKTINRLIVRCWDFFEVGLSSKRILKTQPNVVFQKIVIFKSFTLAARFSTCVVFL